MFSLLRSISKIFLTLLLSVAVLPAIGTNFLSVPSTAAMLAQGDQVALSTESLANPALLPEITAGPQIDFSLGNWLADVNSTGLNYKFGLAGNAANLHLRYLGINDLPFRDERPSDEPLAEYGDYGIALDGGWARTFETLRVGVRVRFAQIRIYEESASGFALDIGAVHTITPKIKAGAAVLNLGKMNALLEEEPLLPLRILAGASFKIGNQPLPTELGVTGEWSSLVDGMILNLGSRSTWNNLTFLLGTTLSPGVVEVSGGFDVTFGQFAIGYGVQIGSQDIGLPQIIDFSVQLP